MSAVLVTAMSSVQARALSLDFEEFAHGEIASVSNNPSYKGVVIAVDNANSSSGHPDLGVAFDSENEVDTRDPDLERGNGWATGNLAPSTELGNVLIIQENGTGCGDGICDRPDDEANRQAGTITLDYSNLDETFNSFQFDLIDIDDVTAEGGSIEFKFLGGLVAFFDFESFADDFGAIWGDNSVNRIDLGEIGQFDEVVITIGGSGGIDNILATDSGIVVPEPSTFVLTAIGLAGLALYGRLRR